MSASAPLASDETLHCARHPETETMLRCGRCDTPICPRCLVATPVGARCPTCARVKRIALLVKPREMARAIAYGIGAAALGTMVLTFIPFLGIIGYAALGFGVGEAVSIGANRKRARELAPIAVACLFVGFEVGTVVRVLLGGEALSIGLLVLPIFALTRGLLILGLLIGALLAWMRVR